MGKTFSTGLLTDGISQDSSNNIGIGVAPSGTNKFEVSGSTKLNGNTAITGSLSVSGSITGSKDALINGLTIGRGGDNMSSNTAIGSGVLQSNITGSYSYGANTGIGYQALFSHVDGTQNTAVGYQSLFSTLSTSNVGIGYQALYSSSYGDGNIGIGYRALYNNYSGGSNVALGYYSLGSNYTGDQNIALGLYTLYYNTTGNSNTAVGTRTLNENITGNNNTALGYTALNYNKTGSYNTAVGDKALINMGGSNNTAIGASAGYGNGDLRARTGTNNIFIGYQSMGVSENDSNRTWIGNTSTTSTWLGGTLLLGTTTSSINILEVSGSTRLQGNITVTGSLSVTGSATTIGATTLSGSLTVSGSATTIGATVLSGSLNVSGSITSTSTITAQTLVVQTITSSVLYSSGSNVFGNALSNTQVMTGSVGITGSLTLNNIAIPTSASLASTYLPLTGGTLTGALNANINGSTFGSASVGSYPLTIQTNVSEQSIKFIGKNDNNNIQFFNSANNVYQAVVGTIGTDFIIGTGTSGTTRLSIASTGTASFSGNVGIGLASPRSILEVQKTTGNTSLGVSSNASLILSQGGTVNDLSQIGFGYTLTTSPAVIGFITTSGAANTKGALIFATRDVTTDTAPTERMRIDASGNVGIGVTSPGAKLHVDGTIFSNTRSNTIDTDDGVSNNFQGYGGYWALRTDNSNRFNLDVYNSGTPISALQLSLAGAATFASSVSIGGYLTGTGVNPGGLGGSRYLIDFSGNYSRFFSYGINNATNGAFLFNSQRSDGTNSIDFLTIASTGAATFNGSVDGPQFTTNAAGVFKLFNDSNTNYWYTRCLISASNNYRFNYNGTDKAEINNSTGAYTALSDINKKKDFELSTIGLNEILGLKPTLYKIKSENETSDKHLGFIAQEVKEFIPQAYTESGEGENKFIGLDYNPIVAALVKAIQELKAEINELKNN
jgi:hypothetical protein